MGGQNHRPHHPQLRRPRGGSARRHPLRGADPGELRQNPGPHQRGQNQQAPDPGRFVQGQGLRPPAYRTSGQPTAEPSA